MSSYCAQRWVRIKGFGIIATFAAGNSGANHYAQIVCSLKDANFIIEQCPKHYDIKRSHSAAPDMVSNSALRAFSVPVPVNSQILCGSIRRVLEAWKPILTRPPLVFRSV